MTPRYLPIRRKIAAPSRALARATYRGYTPFRITDTTPLTQRLAPAEKSPALPLLAPGQRAYNPWQGRRTRIQTA